MLTDAIIEAVLPRARPDTEPAIFRRDAFERAFQSDRERHIFDWSVALQRFVVDQRFAANLPGYQGATFGFVPVAETTILDREVRKAGGYVFGIAIELEPSFDRLLQSSESFRIGDERIPCIYNWREPLLHLANPIGPVGIGTAACWARSRKKAIAPADEGVLTAEHVVRNLPLRSAISMDDGATWHLGDRGTCKIDAALIVRAGSIPGDVVPLPVQVAPIGGTDITFTGVGTGTTVKAKITHTVTHPTYFSDRHPMRIFFDQYGGPGDSGALVRESKSGEAVGLYMGCEPIPRSPGSTSTSQEGVAQLLVQAASTLHVDLFL